MNCPKCKTTVLERTSYGAPYSCAKCGGMWVLNDEISKLSESFINQPLSDSESEINDSRTGLCPEGHGIMIRAKIDFDKPFYLERCTHCGGIWFDQGEWHRIAENQFYENLSEFWTSSWQRKQQQEKNRESFLEMNKKLFGDEIFNALIDLADKLKNHPEKSRALALLKGEII